MKTFPVALEDHISKELDILLTLSKEKNKQKLVLRIIMDALEARRDDIEIVKKLMASDVN